MKPASQKQFKTWADNWKIQPGHLLLGEMFNINAPLMHESIKNWAIANIKKGELNLRTYSDLNVYFYEALIRQGYDNWVKERQALQGDNSGEQARKALEAERQARSERLEKQLQERAKHDEFRRKKQAGEYDIPDHLREQILGTRTRKTHKKRRKDNGS